MDAVALLLYLIRRRHHLCNRIYSNSRMRTNTISTTLPVIPVKQFLLYNDNPHLASTTHPPNAP